MNLCQGVYFSPNFHLPARAPTFSSYSQRSCSRRRSLPVSISIQASILGRKSHAFLFGFSRKSVAPPPLSRMLSAPPPVDCHDKLAKWLLSIIVENIGTILSVNDSLVKVDILEIAVYVLGTNVNPHPVYVNFLDMSKGKRTVGVKKPSNKSEEVTVMFRSVVAHSPATPITAISSGEPRARLFLKEANPLPLISLFTRVSLHHCLLRQRCSTLKAMADGETITFSSKLTIPSASGKKLALISLSDKKNLAFLGNGLQELGYTIVSTGGTASTLESSGVHVTKVEEVTCFPEMLDGRVKTLHPSIHGGILARRDQGHHMDALKKHGIGTFDVVVVNLYPFYEKVTSSQGINFEDGIENIDIGGPAMIRAAAKNHKDVLVVVDTEDYPALLEFLKGSEDDQQFRRKLAWKAFQHVASYDSAVSEWLWKQTVGGKC
ncbi:bifunctional purine biosynthesis protein PurH [Cucumis melo var. makuwa]|uniref:Bifunctional purine biosynthesis protein PurH n=1 Tax=Cucumis melo var. makuwa TaxID=1194695 RepID=A0A5D3BJW6_CUCMM|nr:bifunctional purine biosynthesis protein PurH [Cucumis melo var. makuwa]TYJ99304.1 bifunctional purine biosynthesis protein PurH [Cucumis melo var. makuwa]